MVIAMLNVTLKLESDEYLFDKALHPMVFNGLREVIEHADKHGYTYLTHNSQLYCRDFSTGKPVWICTRLKIVR